MSAKGPATAAKGGFDLLKVLTGSTRDGCFFDQRIPSVDVSCICHEVQSMEVPAGQEVRVSFRDFRKREGEKTAPVGTPCHLPRLDLDTTVLVRVWTLEPEPDASMRECGELRIPLPRLNQKCDGMLYQTWLTLDSPGLRDSVASIGLGMCDDGTDLDQRLADGPRQLFQPKVCLTICKTSDLVSPNDLRFREDTPPDERDKRWGALLRSQQQHVVMNAALYLQRARAGEPAAAKSARSALRLEELQEEVRARERDLEELRGQLQNEEALREAERQRKASTSPGRREAPSFPAPKAERRSDPDVERMRGSNARRRAEIDKLRQGLNEIKEEANRKIDEANERIRSLRQEKDEAVQEAERLEDEGRRLTGEAREMASEQALLVEQKEALMRIVEDLHMATMGAGLGSSGRQSIDGILGYRS